MSAVADIFLCSAGPDEVHARALAAGARASGATVFLAADSLTPGDPVDEVIPATLEGARLVAVLVTPSWRRSRWDGGSWYGPEEVARAIRRQRAADGVRVVPIHADASRELLPYGLARLAPLTVEDGDYEAAGRRLAAVLRGLPLAPSMPAPDSLLVGVPLPLLRLLADNFPDAIHARALWSRAGGAVREVESINRPLDLWQRLWQQSMSGAAARPDALLRAALDELPHNETLVRYLAAVERST